MSETRKTMAFVGAAVVLVVLALVTAPHPQRPDAFFDQGEEFFPDFKDPNAARTLEVIEYDEDTGTAKPFKVTFKDGRWTIPSHYDYPADGRDRLAKTAAGLIGIRKEDFRTDNVADHEACGVIDPLDDTAVSLSGRGTRVTIKGENDVVLADLIIGKPVEGSDNFRLVRVPGQKRVYATRLDLGLSTKFSDWIEADLLKVSQDEIEEVSILDYSVDERSGRVRQRDRLHLVRDGDAWKEDRMTDDQEVDRYKMNTLLRTLADLSIVDVRPKPAGLTATLERAASGEPIRAADMLSLQSKGFFFARDGRLLSNEGEVRAVTSKGVRYTLRFGEIVLGDSPTVGDDGSDDRGENRYLFITASFDSTRFPEPERPANTDFEDKPDSLWTPEDHRMKSLALAREAWERRMEEGRRLARELGERFARWYYVISADSFDKLHLSRSQILRDKPKRG